MPDENLEQQGQQQEQNEYQQYIDKIQELKNNSVSKEEYNKLREENRQLLDSLVQGVAPNGEGSLPPEEKIEDLRKQLFNPDHELNNLEYVDNVLKLRNRILKETGEDIFVARKSNLYSPDQSSYEAAERVAKIFEECIERAEGDPDVFTAELMRRTNDVQIPQYRRK